MSILPRPPVPVDDEGHPPAVAYWRDVIRGSKVAQWVRRHRGLASVAAGLLVMLKTWKWLVVDLIRITWHPGQAIGWVGHHPLTAAIASGAVFAVAAGCAWFGIGWFDGDRSDEDEGAGPRAGADEHRYDRTRRDTAAHHHLPRVG